MSRGLEVIRLYKQATCQHCQYHYGGECNNKDECFSMIIEKELKALEIIKNKGVFVHLLQQSKNVEEYNSLMLIAFKAKAERDYKGAVEKFCLTQEEFDFLKEKPEL